MSFVRLGELAVRLWPDMEHSAIASVLMPVATLPPEDVAAALGRLAFSGEPLSAGGLAVTMRATPTRSSVPVSAIVPGSPDVTLRFLRMLPAVPPDDGALMDDDFLRAANAHPSAVPPGWMSEVERMIADGKLRRTDRGIQVVPVVGESLDRMIADMKRRFRSFDEEMSEPREVDRKTAAAGRD